MQHVLRFEMLGKAIWRLRI